MAKDTYAEYKDTFIDHVTLDNQDADGWVTVKNKEGKIWNLTTFGSKVVSENRERYMLWVRESEYFTFYHLR
jgi:hypothetical protein